MKDINEPYEIAILLDTYGKLLTDKQLDALDLHYNEDLSLAEMAEHYNISRQGVSDTLKKGLAQLIELEEAVHLVEKEKASRKTLEEILRLLKTNKTDEAISFIENTLTESY